MALALARKYRPRNFASVAVQSHVSNTLRGAIARGRVAQGYLLCGPRGTGKTTLARVLAMALNCERRHAGIDAGLAAGTAAGGSADNVPASDASLARDAGEPCGECASCQRIWSGAASLDVVEIDAASNRGVDDARELRERAMYAPSAEDRYKVYIVDEAHMLTREAWNALLKVLEEPPPRVVFVFATTEPQKIAQTAAPVMSRLQRFDLKRIGPAEIRERLAAVLAAEGVPAEPDALAMIARAADGGLRDALSLTDQVLSLGDGGVTAERVRDALGLVPEDEFLALLDLVAERRAGDVFGAVGRLVDGGVDLGLFFTGLGDILRAQLAVVLGGAAGDVSERMLAELQARRDRLAAGDLLRMLAALGELEPRFRRSGQQQLLLETLLVRFALMDRAVELEAVLRELGGGSSSPRGGPARPVVPLSPPSAGSTSSLAGSGPAPPAAPVIPVAPVTPVARDVAPSVGSAGRQPTRAAREVAPPSVPASEAAAGGPPPWDGPKPWEAGPDGGARGATATIVPPPTATSARAAAPDLNRLVERWGEVVARVREQGRVMLATLLGDTLPVAVSASGVVTIEAEDEAAATGLETGRDDLLAALGAIFPGIQRVVVRGSSGAVRPPQRLTTEGIREERLGNLRRRDPQLAEAVDALDLELLD
ncbi:MAG TPA: DNA polymerase III subunit gamma/tau [Gemmatimonadaceae bacterium]|nr:DNA polymerase III subunit gamma/tau [Gemmatimonadaceae bacterium]